jgi:hypothetical protein
MPFAQGLLAKDQTPIGKPPSQSMQPQPQVSLCLDVETTPHVGMRFPAMQALKEIMGTPAQLIGLAVLALLQMDIGQVKQRPRYAGVRLFPGLRVLQSSPKQPFGPAKMPLVEGLPASLQQTGSFLSGGNRHQEEKDGQPREDAPGHGQISLM